MELIIHQIAEKISKEFTNSLERCLLEGENISELIYQTKKMLDEVGGMLIVEVLETADKMDVLLESKLIEEAIDSPYRKSGAKVSEHLELTGQTVMNAIKNLGPVDNSAAPVNKYNEKSKILYIEADEDHVSLQNGKCAEPRLVYVHEGKVLVSKDRYKLINPRYFTGIYKQSADLWLEVASYIDDNYDSECLEKIYLSGDGASWIKQGKEWIKGSIYVLDRFHLSKYVKKATSHIEGLERILWIYINNHQKDYVKELLGVLIEAAETAAKAETIRVAKRYIMNNWEGIINQYNDDYCGCSAEGHISHILSSRLSSRPLSWSSGGVDRMSRLRAFNANGGEVYKIVLQKKKDKIKEKNIIKLDTRMIKNKLKRSTNEKLDNIPSLEIGKRTWEREFFKSLRGA